MSADKPYTKEDEAKATTSLDSFFDNLEKEKPAEEKKVSAPRVHIGGSTCVSCEG